MKITIPTSSLSHALQRTRGAVAGRASIPILSCVLLRAEGQSLQIVASNLDMQISCTVEAKVNEPGVAALPVATLTAYVAQMGPQDIELTIDDNRKAVLNSGSKTCSLSGQPAKDFVEYPLEARKPFSLSQSDLRVAIKQTLISVSTDDTRMILNGVHVTHKSDILTIVSCSGTNLSRVTYDVPGDGLKCTIPTKASNELSRLLGDEGEVAIGLGQNTAEFVMGDTAMTCKLLAEEYPPFQRVIPASCESKISVDREELLSSVGLAASAPVPPNKLPLIRLGFEANRLRVESVFDETATDTMAIKYRGAEHSFRIPSDQLLALLNVLTQDEVDIEIIDDLSPFVIRAGNFYGLIMPMRKS